MEADETEATSSTGPSEAALQKTRFELYEKDLPEVQEVRAWILGLDEGEKATQEDLDSSPDFRLRRAINETCPPTVVGVHWIDHLNNEGCIAKYKPHDFKFEDEWLPLYTRAGVTKQVTPTTCPQRMDCSLGFRGSFSVETLGLFLLWRPLVSFLSFETFGLCFMLFDFQRLSLHTLV